MPLQEINMNDLLDALGITNINEVMDMVEKADEIGLPEWKPLEHHHPNRSLPLNPSVEKAFNEMASATLANDTAEIVQKIVGIPESDLGVPLALTALTEHFKGGLIGQDPKTYSGEFALMMTLFLAGYYYAKDNTDAS